MKSFKVSNFRIFNEKGVEVNFKPVTILTGANSSGKSSFVKSIALMKDYLEEVIEGGKRNPAMAPLEFDPSLKLSGFNEALHKKSKKKQMSFTIPTTSLYAPTDGLKVEYIFKPSPFSTARGELASIRLLLCNEPVLKLESENGHLRSLQFDCKGWMFEFFRSFAKGQLFNNARKKVDQNGEILSALIKEENVDVKNWSEYNMIYHGDARLDILDYRQKKSVHVAGAIKKYDETGIMLFFPLFDVFLSNPEEYSKEQILKKLEALPADEELKRRVISGFSNSTQESFVEYYKKLEDEEMRSFVVKDDSEFNLLGEDLQLMLSRMRYLYRSDTDDYGHAVSIGESSDFSCALRLMHIWQNSLYHESDAFIERKMNSMDSEKEIHASHKIPEVYCEFLLKAIPDLLSPSSLSSFEMVGSSFTPIQRLYSFEDRSSFVSTIKKYIALSRTVEQNSASEEKRKRVQEKRTAFLNGGSDRISMLEASEYLGVEYEPGSFTNKWLDRLGIASRLIIQEDVDGLGFKLFLEKKNSKKRSNLADEGHGITQLISILLNIECGIMLVEINRASGLYGEEEDWFDFAGFNPAVLALEEPEVSLHPCMQSKLADLFEDASKHGVHLIIETHSEYLVRKTQVLVSHLEDKSKNPFAVYYFTEKGNAYELGYSDSGRFIKSFGTGFLDEARNLAMEVFLRES